MNDKIDINTIMQMIASNPAAGAELGAMAGAVNTGGLGRGLTTARKMASSGNTPFSQLNISEEQMLNAQPSPQERYDELQYLGSQGPLSNEEIDEFIMLRNQMNPNLQQESLVNMPFDIDGGSAGSKELTIEDLNKLFERANLMNRR
tara:strand:- start:475 stop:915 length:441 start_codon:yes stop_codon:yes gene_type:complete